MLFVIGGVLLAWLTDRLAVHLVSDSASYLDYSFSSLDQMGRSIRTPGYPLWLSLWRWTAGLQFVPLAQVIVHASAAWWLTLELRRLGMTTRQAVCAGVAVAIGCTPMDHIHTISTDSLSASVGVFVVCSLLHWSRIGRFLGWGAVTAILALAAIMLRPAYLFLIPWLLVAGSCLRLINGRSLGSAINESLRVSLAALIPVVAWMLMRLIMVGDFGMLPFGHQNLGGVLVQLVSDEELKELSGDAGKLGQAVVAQKEAFLQSGRAFAAGEPRATMTIDGRWDDMTYYVVIPAAESLVGGDSIEQHDLISAMNHQIIRRYPVRYLVWLAKNARRGAWAIAADITMHPVFLAVTIGMLIWAMISATVGSAWGDAFEPTPAFRALTVVAFSYLTAKVGFIILTSPAIGRFSDAAAIFLPAWIGVLSCRWCEPAIHSDPAQRSE